MTCTESTENLAAYLHHELTLADDLAMQEHLAECASCREEHASMRDCMRKIQRVPPVEPSAKARAELHRSIDDASGRPRPTAANPALPLRNAAKAFLPFRKLRELPAPKESSASPAPSAPVSLSPSARVVAARLEYLRNRKRNARIRRILICLAGLLLVAGGILSYGYTNWFKKAQQIAAPKPEEMHATARWNERHSAKVKGNSVETLINDQFELGEALSAGRIVKHLDPRSDEACLIIYNENNIKRLESDEQFEKNILQPELASSRELIGAGGKPVIPSEWMEPIFGPDRRAVILTFEDRLEIWSWTKLEKYLNRGPVFNSGM
jgi:hypothetical protein